MNSMLREEAINKWREWKGDDVIFSHFADIPSDLMAKLEILEPRIFEGEPKDSYKEKRWFAENFPIFVVRAGKGAIPKDKGLFVNE